MKTQIEKIRLMQVVPDLGLGGLQQVVVNLCRNIDKTIYDVRVLCLNETGPFAKEIEKLGIEVILLPHTKRNDYFAFRRISQIFHAKRIQVVHTHNTQPFLDSVMASRFSSVERIVHTDHARDFPDKKRYMFLEWIASHFVQHIVGVSDHTSRNLHKYLKIPTKKIKTIPNGIDGSVYDFKVDASELRKSLGLPDCGLLIGLGVRLSEQKGITYLLQALPGILSEHPEVALVIAGSGPLRGALEKEAIDLGIIGKVFFLGPREDMPKILKMLDLYVLPSTWEGLPMVILEAFAAGCPVVATDVGGNSDAIQHRHNGSLVPAKSPGLLQKEVNYLLSRPDLMQSYADNGREVFEAKFSALKMTRSYESLYGDRLES